VLAVDSIDWTNGVEETFKQNAPNGLKNYNEKLKSNMLDIVQLVRGDLTAGVRTTLKALVVIAQHSIYVVANMIDKEVESSEEFEWGSQLRYYWTEKTMTLIAKMVTSEVPYGFEYLGNSLRLVITPLTDRCYRTLMGAKNLNYG
jgi:dynein heavy chain